MEVELGHFSVTCIFKNTEDGFQWAFTGVYGPVERSIGGDFNMVLSPNERNKRGRFSYSMRRFSEVLNELGLRDLPLHRGPFTRRGGLNNQCMSQLDRFLVTVDWESQFSNMIQSTLLRLVADHYSVLLDSKGINSGPMPFRFEIMWLKFDGLKDLLRGWWKSLHFSGSCSFVLASKVKP